MTKSALRLKALLDEYVPRQQKLILRYLNGESYSSIDKDTYEGRATLKQLCEPFKGYRMAKEVQELVTAIESTAAITAAINLPNG